MFSTAPYYTRNIHSFHKLHWHSFLLIGPLSDIIQLLMTALFSMQEEEDDEILETDSQMSGK